MFGARFLLGDAKVCDMHGKVMVDSVVLGHARTYSAFSFFKSLMSMYLEKVIQPHLNQRI